MQKSNYYGVTFKSNGKVYFFKSTKSDYNIGDKVIVDTERGSQLGLIKQVLTKIPSSILEVKDIIRSADDKDYEVYLQNQKDAVIAIDKANKYAKTLDLDMKFVDSSFTFDRKQLLITFLADERVDFRDLAKKLANVYKTRIELRQIGARDKAKEVGGIGQCGRPLCCNSFLGKMESVTMNMAKNQNIALNPNKINGACGRLLCCLAYEDEEYKRCQKGLPGLGQSIKTNDGKIGKVIYIDILNRSYTLELENETREVFLDKNEYAKE